MRRNDQYIYKFKLSELPLPNCLHYLSKIVIHGLQQDPFPINKIKNFIKFKIIKVKRKKKKKADLMLVMKYLCIIG